MHSDKFFEKMAAGLDVDRALSQTQDLFIPRDGPNEGAGSNGIPMQRAGDGMTTLQWVYLTSGERASLSEDDFKYPDWVWIIEKGA